MSTLAVFRTMAGTTRTDPLDITVKQEDEIVRRVSARFANTQVSTAFEVGSFAVSTYIHEPKDPDAGSRFAPFKPVPFASHWGIIVGQVGGHNELYHLVIAIDKDGNPAVKFVNRGTDKLEKESKVKLVGTCQYSHEVRCEIGKAMIEAFGNYHIVFWNCQTFARCYLRVVTGDPDANFDSLTASDAANLFLCAFVIPAPVVTSSVFRQRQREKRLQRVGNNVIKNSESAVLDDTPISDEPTDQEILELSAKIIRGIRDSLAVEVECSARADAIKDSRNKIGVLKKVWAMLMG